jgi:hypothetical protein
MTPQIDIRDRDSLSSLVRGTLHFPDGDGYEEVRQVWSGMIQV